MNALRYPFALLLGLFLLSSGHAQTSDVHVTLGAVVQPDRRPEIMDMSWASEPPLVLPPGKKLSVFILWGDFGREGQWQSKFLPRHILAGKTISYMFAAGRWQSLRPVGIRHGLEIPFGEEMGRLLADEPVGVIVCSGSIDGAISKATRALELLPSEIIAVVQLRERGADTIPLGDEWGKGLGSPDALLINMTPHVPVSTSDLDRSVGIMEKGAAMAVRVFVMMKKNEEK